MRLWIVCAALSLGCSASESSGGTPDGGSFDSVASESGSSDSEASDSGSSDSEASESGVLKGGATFSFSNSVPAHGVCPDVGKEVTLAMLVDGVPKLLIDGADGAHIRCKVDATHFDFLVSSAHGEVKATGSIAGGVSTDAAVEIRISPTDSYASGSVPCRLTFESMTDPGKVFARIQCNVLTNTSMDVACSVNPTGATNSFVQFTGCTGF